MYKLEFHRGVRLADGHVVGSDLICGVHGWDYRLDSGVSSYNNSEALHRFTSWVDGDDVFVDLDEIEAWEFANPQPYDRTAYLGEFADVHGGPEETHVSVALPDRPDVLRAIVGRTPALCVSTMEPLP